MEEEEERTEEVEGGAECSVCLPGAVLCNGCTLELNSSCDSLHKIGPVSALREEMLLRPRPSWRVYR